LIAIKVYRQQKENQNNFLLIGSSPVSTWLIVTHRAQKSERDNPFDSSCHNENLSVSAFHVVGRTGNRVKVEFQHSGYRSGPISGRGGTAATDNRSFAHRLQHFS